MKNPVSGFREREDSDIFTEKEDFVMENTVLTAMKERRSIRKYKAEQVSEELLQKEEAACLKNFEVYKTLVYYRILCESAALKGESKSKRELEKNLKHSVRKRAAYAISSGRLPAETSLGLFLACISPRIQKMAANVRRA